MNEANHDQQRKSEVKRFIYWFLLVLALGEKCASARASPASPVLERAGTQHLPPRNHLVHDQGHHQQQRDEQQQQHEALQQQQQCVTLLEATFPKSFTSLFLTRPIQTYDNVCFGLAKIFSTSSGAVDSSASLSLEEVPRHRFRPPRLSLPVAVPGPPFKSPGPAPSPAPPMPHAEMTSGGFASFHDPDDVLNLTFSFICVLCAAIAAGLTIGLMSIDPLELEIKQRVGTAEECRQASVVLPLIQRHHYLLVTLLLYNSAANETLPLFLDRLVPSYVAVLLSVTMVLIFGEILPSALFSGPNQLKIAARMASFVWFLMLVLSPISYPLSWLLDRFFGSHNPRKRYNRAELSALIEIHQEVKRRNISIVSSGPGRSNSNGTHASAHAYMTASSATSARAGLLSLSHPTHDLGAGSQGAGGKKGGNQHRQAHAGKDALLSQDEVDIVVGVLKIASKTVQDCLVPMEKVFCLSTQDALDASMLAMIMSSGFSRIPVYEGSDRSFLRGFLLVKRLIVLEPATRRRVGSLALRLPLVVSPLCPLIDLLNTFQEGRSHLAVVAWDPEAALENIKQGRSLKGDAAPLGIITLEDVIEEILQEEILDEHDRSREELERRRQRGAKQILSASLLRKEGRDLPVLLDAHRADAPPASSSSGAFAGASGGKGAFPLSSASCIQQQVLVDLTLHSMAAGGPGGRSRGGKPPWGGKGGDGPGPPRLPPTPSIAPPRRGGMTSIYTSPPFSPSSASLGVPLLSYTQSQDDSVSPDDPQGHASYHGESMVSGQATGLREPLLHQRAVSADADSGGGGRGGERGGKPEGRDGESYSGGGTRARSLSGPAEVQQWRPTELQQCGGEEVGRGELQDVKLRGCHPIPEDGGLGGREEEERVKRYS